MWKTFENVGLTDVAKSNLNIKETRKPDKAQRVARPACANAIMHFLLTYRLALLLPPSE